MSDDEKDSPNPVVDADESPPPSQEETEEEDGDARVEWEAPLIPPVGTGAVPGGFPCRV